MLIVDSSSTCGLCEEPYTRDHLPHSIPCGHVACAPCLSKIAAPTRCAFCREVFSASSVRKVFIDLQDTRNAAQGVSPGGSVEANPGSFPDKPRRDSNSFRRKLKAKPSVMSIEEIIPTQPKEVDEPRALGEKLARAVRRGVIAEIMEAQKEVQDWIVAEDKRGLKNTHPMLRALSYLTFSHLNSHEINFEASRAAKAVEHSLSEDLSATEENLKKEKRRRELKELECQDLRNDCARLEEELERVRKALSKAYAERSRPRKMRDVGTQAQESSTPPVPFPSQIPRARRSDSPEPFLPSSAPKSPVPTSAVAHKRDLSGGIFPYGAIQQPQALIPGPDLSSSNLSLSISVSTFDPRHGGPTTLGSIQVPMPIPLTASTPVNIHGRMTERRASSPVPFHGERLPRSPIPIPGAPVERRSSSPIPFEKRFGDNTGNLLESAARPLALPNTASRENKTQPRSQSPDSPPSRSFSSSYEAQGLGSRSGSFTATLPHSGSTTSLPATVAPSQPSSRLTLHGAIITPTAARHFISFYVSRVGLPTPEITTTSSMRDSGANENSQRTQWWQAVMNARNRRIGFGCGASPEIAQNNCFVDAAHYVESLLPALWITFREAEEGVPVKAVDPFDFRPSERVPMWPVGEDAIPNSSVLQEKIRSLGEDLEKIRAYAAKCT